MSDKNIGALWLKEGAKGKYFSGNVEINGQKTNIVIFRNTLKQPGEKTPDYRIFLQQPREDIPEAAPRASAHGDDSDLPF